jgi:hypothetical protein
MWFPAFDEPTPIDEQRSWVATFESYDQRNDDVYYDVSVRVDGRETARFIAQVGLYWAGDDWTGPEFGDSIKQRIHHVAISGESNTTYTGSMVRNHNQDR